MKGKPGSGAARPAQPRPFVIAFGPAKGGPSWQVKQGTRWRSAREVSILAPCLTAIVDGVPALVGDGVVRCTERGHLVVMP